MTGKSTPAAVSAHCAFDHAPLEVEEYDVDVLYHFHDMRSGGDSAAVSAAMSVLMTCRANPYSETSAL